MNNMTLTVFAVAVIVFILLSGGLGVNPQMNEKCREGGCDSLNDWAEYNQLVSEDSILQSYTECGGVFSCDGSNVDEIHKHLISQYDTSTPKKYINAVSRFVGEMITYDLDGGLYQCGESAEDLSRSWLTNNYVKGNCVDYSTVSIALLKKQKIPSRQVVGCVDFNSLACTPYALSPEKARTGLGTTSEGGQNRAHAYIEFWIPEHGWVMADPTVSRCASKCIGYKNVVDSGTSNMQQCYVPFYKTTCF
jgi:hypothetical protein